MRRGGARCVETAARLECRQANIVCNLFFTNHWSESSSFNQTKSSTRSRNVGLKPFTLYEKTSTICSTWCLSEVVLNASNVSTQEGHVDLAVTSFFLYSMPDEHLGTIDHARHDSVGRHGVCFRYLVGT